MSQQICIDYIKLGTGAGELGDQSLPVGFSPGVYTPTPGGMLENHLEGIDDKFDDIVNVGILVKTGVTSPVGITTPDWLGQVFHDTAGNTFWLANGPTNVDWVQIAVGPGAGEANTASNQGATGVGIVLPKVGVDLQFKSISVGGAAGALTVVDDGANDAVRIDFTAGMGDLDDVNLSGLVDGQILQWNAGAGEWQPAADTGESNTASNQGATGIGVFDNKNGTDLEFRNIVSPTGSISVVLDGANKEIEVEVVPNTINLDDLGDVSAAGPVDGDMLHYDGANWIDSKEIGAGHDRNGVGTAAALGGANATVYPGDGAAPYGGVRGVSVGGDGAEVYGDDSVVLNQGRTYGEFSLASGEARAAGRHSEALGASATEAGGDSSLAVGERAQSAGNHSVAIGNNTTLTGIGIKAASLSNSGPDLIVTISGEDLTSLFTGGVTFKIFALTGGSHDPTADANVLDLVVASSTLNLGNTEITVSGINVGATDARLVLGSVGVNAFAMGRGAEARGDYSRAHGDGAIAWGDHDEAFGDGAEAGETGASPQPIHAYAFGLDTKALHNHGRAIGNTAQTRNQYERAFAAGQLDSINWSQARDFLLNNEAEIGDGTVDLYTDYFDGGTEEIATFSGHAYLFKALILGNTRTGAATRKAAGWIVEGVAVNESGTLRIVGVNSTNALGNDDASVFDTAPVVVASGSDLRVTVADDGTGTTDLHWVARIAVAEIGALA